MFYKTANDLRLLLGLNFMRREICYGYKRKPKLEPSEEIRRNGDDIGGLMDFFVSDLRRGNSCEENAFVTNTSTLDQLWQPDSISAFPLSPVESGQENEKSLM